MTVAGSLPLLPGSCSVSNFCPPVFTLKIILLKLKGTNLAIKTKRKSECKMGRVSEWRNRDGVAVKWEIKWAEKKWWAEELTDKYSCSGADNETSGNIEKCEQFGGHCVKRYRFCYCFCGCFLSPQPPTETEECPREYRKSDKRNATSHKKDGEITVFVEKKLIRENESTNESVTGIFRDIRRKETVLNAKTVP